MKDEI
jgi:bloom syndrome protein